VCRAKVLSQNDVKTAQDLFNIEIRPYDQNSATFIFTAFVDRVRFLSVCRKGMLGIDALLGFAHEIFFVFWHREGCYCYRKRRCNVASRLAGIKR
jgi:hypothetical protein